MSRAVVTFPEFLFAAATRAIGGVGLGLLISDRLTARERRVIGASLLAVAVGSTIPLVARIVPRVRRGRPGSRGGLLESDIG